MERAVADSIGELAISPEDSGVAELALTYARKIDNEDGLEKIGPLLLNALEALGLTPRARKALLKGGTDASAPKSPLDELRARRNLRVNNTKAVDTTAS